MKRFEYGPGEDSDNLSLHHDAPEVDVESLQTIGSQEKLKDFLFDQFMKQQLVEDFFESLGGYLSEDEIDEMRGELVNYTDEEIYSALSLPHELREKRFEMFESALAEGKSPTEVVQEYLALSNRHGFSIGYHCSPVDLRPDEEGCWLIKGTEADHRDDDRMMAYYSTQYRHLFKKRHPKYIYIVRTDPTHKTDGNWSRADSLGVIARVPFEDVNQYVESTAKEIAASSQKEEAA